MKTLIGRPQSFFPAVVCRDGSRTMAVPAVTARSARSVAPCKASTSEPGSTRRVTPEDVERLSQVFGPTRYSVPQPKSPSVLEDAGIAAMLAIEAAREWQELKGIFDSSANSFTPIHILALVEALARLVPDTLTDMRRGEEAEGETPKSAAAAMQQQQRRITGTLAFEDVGEMQEFGKELMDVCRYAVENHYRLHQSVSLLSSFVSIGVLPPNSWMAALDRAMLRTLDRSSHEDAATFIAAAANVSAIQYTPSRDWVQALAECALLAFSPMQGASSSPSSSSRFRQRSTPRSSSNSMAPTSVVLANGEEVELSQPDEYDEDEEEEEEGEDSMLQLPAESLAALAQAMMQWDMEVDADWLLCYLRALYDRMTDGDMNLNQLSDCAWSLIMSEVKPDDDWLQGLVSALTLAMEREAEVGPRTVASILGALDEFECDPGQRWVEAALEKVARSEEEVPADLLGYVLFEGSKLGRPVSAGDATDAVAVLAQKIQISMLQTADALGNKATAAAALEKGDLTPYGLTLMIVGLDKLGVLSRMPEDWMEAWAYHAIRQAGEFIQDQVMGVVVATKNAGIALPQEAVGALVSRLLLPISTAVVPEPGTLGKGGQPWEPPTNLEYALGSSELILLMDLLSVMPFSLPSAWLRPLRVLIEKHQSELTTANVMSALGTIARVGAPKDLDQAPDPAAAQMLKVLMVSFREAGGMADSAMLLDAAGAVKVIGDVSGTVMAEIEEASVRLAASQEGGLGLNTWESLLQIFVKCEHAPRAGWWTGFLAEFKGLLERGEVPDATFLCGALVAYADLLIMWTMDSPRLDDDSAMEEREYIRPNDAAAMDAAEAWCEVVALHSLNRLVQIHVLVSADELTAILGGLQALQSPLPYETCERVCAFMCETQAGSEQATRLLLLTTCLQVFNQSAYVPSKQWQELACRIFLSKADEEGDSRDVLVFLVASYRFREEFEEDGGEEENHLTSMLDLGGPELVPLLMKVAYNNAGTFSQGEVLGLITACVALNLGAALRAPPGVLPAMLGAATESAGLYRLDNLTSLFAALRDLNVKPGAKFIEAFFTQLEALFTAAMEIAAEEGVEGPFQGVFYGDVNVLGALVSSLDAWSVPLPPKLLPSLPQLLLPLCDEAPEVAVDLMHYMSSMRQVDTMVWQPDLAVLAKAMAALIPLVKTGKLANTKHAPLMFSVARLCRRIPAAARVKRSSGGGSEVELLLKAASELASVVVDVSTTAPLAAYTVTDALVMFSAFTSLRHPMPRVWSEQLFEHTGPALTACSPEMVSAAVASCAYATSIALPMSFPTRPDGDQADSVESVPLLSSSPPHGWLLNCVQAIEEQLPRFKLSDMLMVLDSLSALGVRPDGGLLQDMLDSGMRQAKAAAADKTAALAAEGPRPPASQLEPVGGSAAVVAAEPSATPSPSSPPQDARRKQLQRLQRASTKLRAPTVPVPEAEQLARMFVTVSRLFEYNPGAEWKQDLKALLMPFLPMMDPKSQMSLKALLADKKKA